jgi:hypothetical protein
MNKDQKQRENGGKKPEHIKKMAASVPPDCPLCAGQTEWMRTGEIYVCHFCGRKWRAEQ